MLEKSINDLLFLAHKFLAFFQPVGLTLDVNDGAVMQDTIQDGGGNGDVGKDFVPLGESLIRGEYGGGFLIPPGNELKEQVRALNVQRKIADLVNNEHSVFGQSLEFVRQTVLEMGLLELLNELVAVDIVSGEPVLRRYQAQGRSQVGFTYPRRAKEHHVFSVFQKPHGGQLVNLALVNGGLEGEVEIIQGLPW